MVFWVSQSYAFLFQAYLLKVLCRLPLRMRMVKSEIEQLFCEKCFPTGNRAFCPMPLFCGSLLWSTAVSWFHQYSSQESIRYIE